MTINIGDQRKAGEAGPAGDQREAGESGAAGDPRLSGEATVKSTSESKGDEGDADSAKPATRKASAKSK